MGHGRSIHNDVLDWNSRSVDITNCILMGRLLFKFVKIDVKIDKR